jgi:5-dehydro-2-deoxygluconokinase
MTPRSFDVLALGRVGVDLYPNADRDVGLAEVSTFEKFLGRKCRQRGGRRRAVRALLRPWSHAPGDDPFGDFVRNSLREFGVHTEYVRADPTLPTPVTFCELFPPDTFPLYFYRYPTAPDLRIGPGEIPPVAVRDARLFWATLTGLSAEPSRSAHEEAWDVRGRARHTVIDLDYRDVFWLTEADATRAAESALAASTVAVGNLEECRVAVGETEAGRAADALLERGIELAIVKQGPRGVLAATAEERIEIPAQRVEVVNGLGAGDAFGGAICHGLLSGWGLERMLRFASAAGAHVAARLECAAAMPTEAEVEALLAGGQD